MKTIEYPLTIVERKFGWEPKRADPYEPYEKVKEFALERRINVTDIGIDTEIGEHDFYHTYVEFSYIYDIKDEQLAIEFEKSVVIGEWCLVSSDIIENFTPDRSYRHSYKQNLSEEHQKPQPPVSYGSAIEALRARAAELSSQQAA